MCIGYIGPIHSYYTFCYNIYTGCCNGGWLYVWTVIGGIIVSHPKFLSRRDFAYKIKTNMIKYIYEFLRNALFIGISTIDKFLFQHNKNVVCKINRK